ncbi:MAG: hypothetical protein M3O50_18335 [Myxococcota bacterium]|nr:hypothetical protein [Myxococcota bacterium]
MKTQAERSREWRARKRVRPVDRDGADCAPVATGQGSLYRQLDIARLSLTTIVRSLDMGGQDGLRMARSLALEAQAVLAEAARYVTTVAEPVADFVAGTATQRNATAQRNATQRTATDRKGVAQRTATEPQRRCATGLARAPAISDLSLLNHDLREEERERDAREPVAQRTATDRNGVAQRNATERNDTRNDTDPATELAFESASRIKAHEVASEPTSSLSPTPRLIDPKLLINSESRAAAEMLGVTDVDVRWEAWKAKCQSKGSRSCDWQAEWRAALPQIRNWQRTDAEQGRANGVRRAGSSSLQPEAAGGRNWKWEER